MSRDPTPMPDVVAEDGGWRRRRARRQARRGEVFDLVVATRARHVPRRR